MKSRSKSTLSQARETLWTSHSRSARGSGVEKVMHIELDTVAEVLTVDDVKISIELLRALANPDPKRTYRMERRGNDVVVMESRKE